MQVPLDKHIWFFRWKWHLSVVCQLPNCQVSWGSRVRFSHCMWIWGLNSILTDLHHCIHAAVDHSRLWRASYLAFGVSHTPLGIEHWGSWKNLVSGRPEASISRALLTLLLRTQYQPIAFTTSVHTWAARSNLILEYLKLTAFKFSDFQKRAFSYNLI